MLSAIMLSDIMLSSLSVIMLNVVILSDIRMSVVAPNEMLKCIETSSKYFLLMRISEKKI
jgi:hypothetical protein